MLSCRVELQCRKAGLHEHPHHSAFTQRHGLADHYRPVLLHRLVSLSFFLFLSPLYSISYVKKVCAAESQYIIDTMVDALRRDAARRFTFVEMGYFYRWWREQSDARKAQVRELVNEGTCPGLAFRNLF